MSVGPRSQAGLVDAARADVDRAAVRRARFERLADEGLVPGCSMQQPNDQALSKSDGRALLGMQHLSKMQRDPERRENGVRSIAVNQTRNTRRRACHTHYGSAGTEPCRAERSWPLVRSASRRHGYENLHSLRA